MAAKSTRVAVIGVLLLITLYLSIMLFWGAWWSLKSESNFGDVEYISTSEFKINEIQVEYGSITPSDSTFDEVAIDYEEFEDDEVGFHNVAGLFKTIFYLMLAISILTAISLILVIGAYFSRKIFNVLAVTLIITFILAVFTAVGFAVGLPMAFDEDNKDITVEIEEIDETIDIEMDNPSYAEHFAGEETYGDSKLSWGPSGWFLVVIVFILTGFSAIIALFPLKQQVRDKISRGSSEVEEAYKEAIIIDEPQAPIDKSNVFQCPKCGNDFKISTAERPVTIRCPHCKVEGTIS